jgi:hypothetical protein
LNGPVIAELLGYGETKAAVPKSAYAGSIRISDARNDRNGWTAVEFRKMANSRFQEHYMLVRAANLRDPMPWRGHISGQVHRRRFALENHLE